MHSPTDASQDASIVSFSLTPNSLVTQELLNAFDHFLLLNSNVAHVGSTLRRVFFEFLRQHPHLTDEEIDDIRGLSDFLAACQEAQALRTSAQAA